MSQSKLDRPDSGSIKRVVRRENSGASLVVLRPEDSEKYRPDRQADAYSSTSDVNGSKTSASHSRTTTPSKKVSLSLTKKENSSDSFGTFDWEEYNRLEAEKLYSVSKSRNQSKTKDSRNSRHNRERTQGYQDSRDAKVAFDVRERVGQFSGAQNGELSQISRQTRTGSSQDSLGAAGTSKDSGLSVVKRIVNKEDKANRKKKKEQVEKRDPEIDDSDAFDTDLEDGEEKEGDESSSEAEEERKAPTQLLMEFLQAVMSKKWELAQKLCTMILIYQPNHPEALMYKDVIEERIQFEAEKAAESESSSSESSDDEDSDDEGSRSGSEDSGSESENEVTKEKQKGKDKQKTDQARDGGESKEACRRH